MATAKRRRWGEMGERLLAELFDTVYVAGEDKSSEEASEEETSEEEASEAEEKAQESKKAKRS